MADVDDAASNTTYRPMEIPGRMDYTLETVQVWHARGRVPFAAEATAFLTEADLMAEGGPYTYPKRLSCSMAIIRFVNGILDPAQKAQYAVSLYTLAGQLGLPASFVDIRHAATHEHLPHLSVLKAAVQRALDWLETAYWAETGLLDSQELSTLHGNALELIKMWKRLKLKQSKQSQAVRTESATIKQQFAELASYREVWEAMCLVLVQEMTDLRDRVTESSMRVQFSAWMPLLDTVFNTTVDSSSQNLFIQYLVAELLHSTSTKAAGKWKMVWLERLLRPDNHRKSAAWQSQIDVDELASQAALSKDSNYAAKLLELFIETRPSLFAKYEALLHLFNANPKQGYGSTPKTAAEMVEELEQRKQQLTDLALLPIIKSPIDCAWPKCRGWKPRPIGSWIE